MRGPPTFFFGELYWSAPIVMTDDGDRTLSRSNLPCGLLGTKGLGDEGCI